MTCIDKIKKAIRLFFQRDIKRNRKSCQTKQYEKSPEKFYGNNMDDIVTKISLVEERIFYDTTWDVTVKIHRQDFIRGQIIRDDTETPEHLDALIREHIEEEGENILKKLDKRNSIYYD